MTADQLQLANAVFAGVLGYISAILVAIVFAWSAYGAVLHVDRT